MTLSTSDVCVIGGGIVGLAAAASLLDRGIDVTCFERAEPGDGQSAGRTRQFRHLHQAPELIELAVHARDGWRQWEQRFGRALLGSEGALRAGAERVEAEALLAAGVPALALNPGAARERFPLAGELSGMLLWDPLAGAIRAADAVAALTGRIGSALRRTEASAIALEPGGESVTVQTSSGVHRSARCMVCAGAGTDRLVRPVGLDVRQDRQAHLRLAFRTRTTPVKPLPCFSDRSGAAGEHVYGLSDFGDRYAVGLATVTTYPAVEDLAAEVPASVDVSSQRERIIAYVRKALPGLDPRPVDEVLRLTTTLPDHPEDGFETWRRGPVLAVAGPNLFKFAPAIGELMAAVATDQPTDGALSRARGTPVAPSR
jgi:sarcosine oxidase